MNTYGGPPLTCGQQNAEASFGDNTGQNMDKGHWNIERPSPYTPWNNSAVEKNVMSGPRTKPRTSWSVGNDFTSEPCGHMHWLEILRRNWTPISWNEVTTRSHSSNVRTLTKKKNGRRTLVPLVKLKFILENFSPRFWCLEFEFTRI